ncbi:MAG TPA: discoidin domain-containing protein, partial [Bacteroidales bacterium]|nr:discoidin domain-containing protein [Bacteroidales bacterium]
MKQLYTKTLLCLLALTLFFTGNVSAQVAGEFRSVGSGDWNSVGTWETYNGATWAPATIIPNSATVIVTVQSGHTLTVSSPVQVKTLKLDGIVTTTSVNTLTVNYLGSIVGGSAAAYIDGPLNLQVTTGIGVPKDINVPLGKGSVGRPVLFRVGHNRANLVTYMLEMFNSAPPARTLPATLASVSSTRYYTIARTNVAGLTSNCNLTLRYDTDDAVGSFNSLLRIVRDGATAWTDLGGIGSAPVTGTITSATPTPLTASLSLASPTNNVFTLAMANSIISGNAGVAGATLSWVDGGVTKTTVSAANGTYTIYVPAGWSGTITPSLQYYNFTPADMTYTSVSGNLTNQNYTAASIFTDFRSAGPGDWNDPLIWEGWDGTTWVPSSVPTGVAGSILIRAGDVVNVNVPVSLEAGCTLTNEGQLNVNGSLTVKANATLINIGLFGEPGGTLNVYGTLEHRQDGGMIGVAGNFGWTATNYYAGSKILVTGVINVAPTVPVQTSFQSMVWDCPNQADDVFLNINGIGGAPSYKDLYTGFGNLTVLNSNSKNIFMFSGQGRAVGNIVVDGPSSRVTAFTHTSSGIEYLFFSYFSSLTVQNGGQFYMTTNTGSDNHYVTINLWNNLTVSSNSVLATYSSPGITGTSTALIGFAPNYPHTLDLSGQVPAPGLDAAANNLNVFIDGNTVTLASPITLNSLRLSGTGRIISGGNLITMLPGGTVSGESATSFTDGPVAFQVATTDPTTLTFPVGKGSVGRPVILYVTQDAATPTTYTAEMMNPPVPSNTLPSSLGSVSTVRYYNITKSAGANVTDASVLLNYSTDDGVTDNALLRIAKADGSGNWVDLGGTGTAPSTGTITSTSNFTDFTGSSFVLGTSLTFPKITGNTGVAGVTLSWNDAGVKTTVSDANGDYTINVPPGWSGTVTPSLAGYSFTPANISYMNVLTDQVQNFTGTALENVALNKPATSQGAQTAGYEPSKANDADGTNASFWSGSGYPQWWEVNLGGMYDLSSIVVRNWVDG